MDKKILEKIDELRGKYNGNKDGGPGSGNWGHVGRIGQQGGSEKGGGVAFRMTNQNYKPSSKAGEAAKSFWSERQRLKDAGKDKDVTMKNVQYISKAVVQSNLRDKAARAERKGNYGKQKIIEHQMSLVDMKRKSIKNISDRFDPEASRNILADKERGKTTSQHEVGRSKGTYSAISSTFKNKKKVEK